MIPVRIFDFLDYQLETLPLERSISTKVDGQWKSYSSREFKAVGNTMAKALISKGIQAGENIALISTTNRSEWNIMDYAISSIGAVSVPLYPNITHREYEYVLNHSQCTYCFVSDKELYHKINTVQSKVDNLKHLYTFDEVEGAAHWKELLELGKSNALDSKLSNRKAKVRSSHLATIIYTSGTTGVPKGVMLSHHNLVSNVLSSSKRIPFDRGTGKALSFLPVCHSFERIIHYIYIFNGIEIYFAESLEKLSDNLKEVQPYIITAVPRLIEKVFDRIIARGKALKGIKRTLFFWAVNLGLQYQPYGVNGKLYDYQLRLARKLIFSKWREGLGGNLHYLVSGSAPLQPRLAQVFTAAGMTVMEGYGLTETSPVVSVNDMRNGGLRFGTVGKPISGIQVTIAKDGEIIVQGPNVMQGYYRQEDLTKEVLQNGAFHTGDIGELDEDGFLKITDRKKEIFKNSAGKYISPQGVENILKQSPFIEHLLVLGANQKMPSALINIDVAYSIRWLKNQNIESGLKRQDLINIPQLKEAIKKDVVALNAKLNEWEQVTKFELVDSEWSIESGHLTPTMKLKRSVVEESHQDLVDKLLI